MQDQKILRNLNVRQRRIFRFKYSWVEIVWHIGRQSWAGEAYILATRYGDPVWSGVVFSQERRKIVGLLRMAIAESRNPKIKEVSRKILGQDDSSNLTFNKIIEARKKLGL